MAQYIWWKKILGIELVDDLACSWTGAMASLIALGFCHEIIFKFHQYRVLSDEEILEWAETNLKNDFTRMGPKVIFGDQTYLFLSKDDAMLFKLTF
jgi:hypothetical protein